MLRMLRNMLQVKLAAVMLIGCLILTSCGGGGEDDEGSSPIGPPSGEDAQHLQTNNPPTQQNALDISVFGEGDIRVQGASGRELDCTMVTMCQGMFNQGDAVILIAEPDSGWTHDSWIGCDRQDALDRCTVFIDDDRLVSVTFLSADPLEFDNNVIVLRNDQFQGLIDYDLDTGRLVFNAATDGASQWAIGTILLAAENPDEGLTLARRITGIQAAGTHIVFSTEQASLEEIFRSGSFSYTGSADAGGIRQYPDPIVTQSEEEEGRIPINISLGGGVTAGGWITFPVASHFAVNFSPAFEFRLIAIAIPTASIGVEISRKVTIEAEKELLSKRLGTILIPNPLFPALPIPVYPTLKLFVAGDAEASATLGVGASMSVITIAGVHYKDRELNRIFKAKVDPEYRVSSGVDFDLSWDVEVRARGELQFNLLGVAGPFVGVVPYLGIMSECGDDFAETYKGWRLEVGGDLTTIGGPRLAIPAYESHIAQRPLPLNRITSVFLKECPLSLTVDSSHSPTSCRARPGDPGTEPGENVGCTTYNAAVTATGPLGSRLEMTTEEWDEGVELLYDYRVDCGTWTQSSANQPFVYRSFDEVLFEINLFFDRTLCTREPTDPAETSATLTVTQIYDSGCAPPEITLAADGQLGVAQSLLSDPTRIRGCYQYEE